MEEWNDVSRVFKNFILVNALQIILVGVVAIITNSIFYIVLTYLVYLILAFLLYSFSNVQSRILQDNIDRSKEMLDIYERLDNNDSSS